MATNKIILKDKTSYEISEGTGINRIIISLNSYDEIASVEEALTKPENLNEVKFSIDDVITGEYENLKLVSKIFDNVRTEDNKVIIEIGLREMTETELAIDKLQKGQTIQDSAIADLGEVVSDITPTGV